MNNLVTLQELKVAVFINKKFKLVHYCIAICAMVIIMLGLIFSSELNLATSKATFVHAFQSFIVLTVVRKWFYSML